MKGLAATRRVASEYLARSTRVGKSGFRATALRRLTGRPDNSMPAWWFIGRPNFGDLISPVILRLMCGIEPIRVNSNFRGKILGAGSILKAARPDDIVWGSGLIAPVPFNGRGIRFAAVRGPRTRELIDGDVPERYGDPGILMPLVYAASPTDRRYGVGLVPHYKDKDVLSSADAGVLAIDTEAKDWKTTIDKIVSCDVIVSSSLHGVVIAEAYGVPAVWVQPTDRLKGGEFKFHDYYEGTGREARRSVWTRNLAAVVDEAVAPPELDRSALMVSRPRFT